MSKVSTLLAALLFASASAFAAGTTSQPTQPATTGAASVQTQLNSTTGAAAKSDGHATKGLTTAEHHITAQHGKVDKDKGKAEKAEHAEKPEHPAKPERPGR